MTKPSQSDTKCSLVTHVTLFPNARSMGKNISVRKYVFLNRERSKNMRHMRHPTRWLITPHPADLSRVTHQRLVREYVPFASACLNSHNAGEAAVGGRWSEVCTRPKGDIQRATSLRPDRTDFRRIAKILTNPNSCTAGRRCRSDLPLKSPLLAICDGSKNRAQQ